MTEGMRKAADASRERATAAREAVGERIDAAKEATAQRMEATGERVEAAKAATGERVEAAKVAAGERVDAAKVAAVELHQKVKPKLRGVIHEYSFPVSLVAGGLLVYFAAGGRERLALAIYAISLSALLGTSALYHRVNWKRTSARMWMRRLDHSMIFLLIAGTVTPFLLLVVGGTLGTALLIAVWAGALAGIFVEVVWVNSPRWVSVAVYLTVGWIGAIAFPSIVTNAGVGAGVLIATGGLLYTIGAVVYAKQRPDPSPTIFGYHEIFHVLVVAAAVAHFTAIAIYAAPTGDRGPRPDRRAPHPRSPCLRGRHDRPWRAASGRPGARRRVPRRPDLDRDRTAPPLPSPDHRTGLLHGHPRRLPASRRADHGRPGRERRVLGVSVSFEPGAWPIPEGALAYELGWLLLAGPMPARRGLDFDRRIRAAHVPHPHVYLWFLAVDPAFQSRGVGRALLAELHAESAGFEVPTYLETGKMENVTYYASTGYEVIGDLKLSTGRPMWLMERPHA